MKRCCINEMQSVRQQFITAHCPPKIYVIPVSSIRSIIFNEQAKCMTINYTNDLTRTELYAENIKKVYYDTIKDMRSCDGRLTEFYFEKIVEV